MKVNTRGLPRLNLCYLQKKAFENHRQNINRIKSSLETRTKRDVSSNQKKFPNNVRPHRYNTLPDQSSFKPETVVHLTPFQKKMKYETEHQNNRLFQAINKCRSTISRKEIEKHCNKTHEDLDRMAKFRVDPYTNKRVLKNKLSLQKISSLQKNRNSRVISRLTPSCPTTTSKEKSYIDNLKVELPKKPDNPIQKFRNSLSTREEHFKSLIKKNLRKIKDHFQDKEFQLIAEARLNRYRQKEQSSISSNMLSPQVHKWKTRCFTTQTQVYE